MNKIADIFIEAFTEIVLNSFPNHKGRKGKIGGSLPKGANSNRQYKSRNKERKAVELPKEDMSVIYHNIETFGFTEDEIKDVYTAKYSANYGVVVKINNAEYENLSYTIIKKWKLK